ncbi:M14 family zinc carboxypeptidase [Paucihalobacter sp.]|uniref:M14 family zinc carboxypeptidase n=1 Tax=Paucihalobacter sp. TaxID=2850405 RepID=UPI003D1616EE
MRLLSLLLIVALGILPIQAQLKSPSQFFGYELGSEFTRHYEVVDYFEHVASSNKNQVKLEYYGKTNERRDLMIAVISSEENVKNLESIRNNNLANIGITDGDKTKNNPAIVWLSYNVHGNEASSTEASMLTIYKLLTEKQEWLKNTIVIIDPCLNPDGRDRYVNWFNETASKPYNTSRQASEHSEPWPGGRPNHYLFDLNRDWAWATQIETQTRIKVYNKWMPHIHVDFHEQGINEPYYFAPAAEPFHEIITDWQRDFQIEIGKNNAKYFDENGWLYFTRERFDLFYPSYGDTYPTYMGAIGMTYEQAGHGMAGLGILNDEGVELTLVDRLTHHTTSGLATVEMAHKNAEKLNEEFAKFFNNKNFKYKSYVIQGSKDKIDRLKSLLLQHGIKFGSPKNIKVTGYKYSTGTQGSINTSASDLVVSTNQPKGNMVKVLFEPNAKLSDSLTYDITAWSIPYAHGLEAIAATQEIEHFEVLERLYIEPLKDAYGYINKWNDLEDAKFLSALLQANIRVRFNEKPLIQKGITYQPGSLIITKGDNQKHKDFVNKLDSIAQEYRRQLSPISSGFSDVTPDIGSPDIKLINQPKIALLSGDGTSSLSFGELWHFFEKQLNFQVTVIHTNHFRNVNWSDFNVLVMPSGYYGSVLTEDNLKSLKDWISKGGKVVAIDGAMRAFTNDDSFGLQYKTKEETEKTPNLTTYANQERANTNQMITGAIFKTTVDATHPLAFGYGDQYFTLKLGNTNYKLLDSGYNVAYIDNNTKPFSGFAGSEAIKNLNQTMIFGEQPYGRGSLIYLSDNPMFRSFWENGKLFLINAIFFVNNNSFTL